MRARIAHKGLIMTIEEAKSLARGEYVHHVTKTNSDGSPMRARVTSIKTWKTRPNCVEVRVKHGLYEYATFSETELGQIEKGYN